VKELATHAEPDRSRATPTLPKSPVDWPTTSVTGATFPEAPATYPVSRAGCPNPYEFDTYSDGVDDAAIAGAATTSTRTVKTATMQYATGPGKEVGELRWDAARGNVEAEFMRL
jgi:hypothetical protein